MGRNPTLIAKVYNNCLTSWRLAFPADYPARRPFTLRDMIGACPSECCCGRWTSDDVAVLEQLTQDPEITGEFEWSGWYDLRSLRRGWDDNGLIGPDGGTLMVVRDDEPLGGVNWRRHKRRRRGRTAGRWASSCCRTRRGHGYGTEAHRLLVRYLFAHTTVHRIEAVTEVSNAGERRVLEKAGFTREGVMREIGWRDGAWRDSAALQHPAHRSTPPEEPGCPESGGGRLSGGS